MSLTLGLIAALAWGIHDLCVRYVSQTVGIFASLVAVLGFGSILVIPVSFVAWGEPMGDNAITLAILAGLLFGLAGIALYKAFAIGPVRLVAPIIGAYPILSVAWAAATGSQVPVDNIMAVGLIIACVGYVAGSGDDGETKGKMPQAIAWSVAAGTGFAISFAIGQAASANGGELSLLTPTRLAALGVVLAIAIVTRAGIWLKPSALWILAIMGVLDAIALACVISSGGMENPEFASVAASTFGLVTIVMAAIFLKEQLSFVQWSAVVVVFCSIAYLGLFP